jgi:hypothetical protein
MSIINQLLLNVNPLIGALILYLMLVAAAVCFVSAMRKSPGDKS